jgi:hypothetical protein
MGIPVGRVSNYLAVYREGPGNIIYIYSLKILNFKECLRAHAVFCAGEGEREDCGVMVWGCTGSD